MDFNFSDAFKNVNSFLGSNNGLSQLANNVISGLGPKPAPKVVQQAPAIQTIQLPPAPSSSQGMSKGMMVGIGAGVLAIVLVLVLVLKRK